MWEASECAPTHGNYAPSVMVCVTILTILEHFDTREGLSTMWVLLNCDDNLAADGDDLKRLWALWNCWDFDFGLTNRIPAM